MKKLSTFLALLICYAASATPITDTVPTALPTRFGSFYNFSPGYLRVDSGILNARRDTSWIPRYGGAQTFWQHTGVDTTLWVWDTHRWKKLGEGSGSSSVDTFAISTRAWRQKLADSLGAIITANTTRFGTATDPSATANRAFTYTSHNFQISGGDTMTLSGSKTYIEGQNSLKLFSTDSVYLLSSDRVTMAGVTVTNTATTKSIWGYRTGTSDSTGWEAQAGGLFANGLAITSSAAYKPLQIDTTNGKIGWKLIDLSSASQVTGTLASGNGGTGFATYTTGDILYASATNVLSKLPIGTAAQTLHVVGGVPAWRDTSGSSLTLSAIGSSANANGATLTGSALNLEPASASFGGVVTTGTQTIAGDKTLSGNTYLTGTVQTNATSENGNLYIASAQSVGSQSSNALYEIAATAIQYRVAIGGGTTNPTITANGQYAGVVIPATTVTEASSGTHNAITAMLINGLTVTNAAASVTRTALLYFGTNVGATGATNYGIYNAANTANLLAPNLSTNSTTTTSDYTLSTGASTFGSGGTNNNLYVKTTASNTSNIILGINSAITHSGASGTSTQVGAQSTITTSAGVNAVATSYIGFRSDISNNGTGTITNVIGFDANVGLGNTVSSNAGVFTNGYGLKVNTPTRTDSAKFGAYYGVYLDTVKASWATGNIYGVYQVDNYNNLIYNVLQSKTAIGSTTTPTSTLTITGSLATAYTSTAVDYTATATDCVIEVTVTGKTVTLPTAVGCTGRLYTVKLTASGSGTVATTSSQNIDASTTYSLSAQYKYVTVQSNGTKWLVIANN